MRRALAAFLGCCSLAALVVALNGCSDGPAVEPDHQRLLASLRTAISARNAAWLQQNVEFIAAAHARQEMSDEVRAAFDEVIALAQDRQWQAAEERLAAWQAAQTPTAEQQARASRRELPRHDHAEAEHADAAHADGAHVD